MCVPDFAPEDEICDGFDNDCDGVIPPEELVDEDGDGYPECDDCDDDDPLIGPAAPETCGDGIDSDCDGLDGTEETDIDGDGWDGTNCGGQDCVDTDPSIHPLAAEICSDGIDQDCDGADLPCGVEGIDLIAGGGCVKCAADVGTGGARGPGLALVLMLGLAGLRRRRG